MVSAVIALASPGPTLKSNFQMQIYDLNFDIK